MKRRINDEPVDSPRNKIRNHWRNKEYKNSNNDVIDLTADDSHDTKNDKNDSDVVDLTVEDAKSDDTFPWPKDDWCFRLFKSPIYNDNLIESDFFISMTDIFNDKSIEEIYLFSFQFDMNYIYNLINPIFYKNIKRIWLLAQPNTIIPLNNPIEKYLPLIKKTIIRTVNMKNKFSCNHSKLIIIKYNNNNIRFFLPSNNLTEFEEYLPQNVCWISPLIPKVNSTEKKEKPKAIFYSDLIKYFSSYPIKLLRDMHFLSKYDFSILDDMNIKLIFSTPNIDTISGLDLLEDTFKEKNLIAQPDDNNSISNYFCQVSSIGAPMHKNQLNDSFTDVLVPIFNNNSSNDNTNISLLFPTYNEINRIIPDENAGNWFHFNKKCEKSISLVKQDDTKVSRNRKSTPSHSKFYMKWTSDQNNNTKYSISNLDWCLYTSANLSMSAWGKAHSKVKAKNYELGILITPNNNSNDKIKYASFVDLIYNRSINTNINDYLSNTILTPYSLPGIKYDKNDTPFINSFH